MKYIIVLFFSAFLFSCDNEDSVIDIPSFSIKPMRNSSVKSIDSSSSKTEVRSSSEVKSLVSIGCLEELSYWNDAPQLVGGSNLPGIDYIVSFYAGANFYDCSAQLQAQENGPEETLQGDLTVFKAESIGDVPEDNTRFVSWSENADKSEIKGKMVNLYLQNDQARTKTRADLSDSNGVKTVNAMFKYEKDIQMYTRAFFQEVPNSEGEIVEHIIGGRHYNSRDKVIISVLASVKREIGGSVFVVKCSDPSSFNAECPFSSPQEQYYNAKGEVIDKNAATELGLETDFANFPKELILSSFYDEPESEYFDPSL